MKDQELRDIFHAYRPDLGDEEDFMARLNEQMDAIDAKQQQPRIIPLYRKWLPWTAGIAAVIAIAVLFGNGQTEPPTEAHIQTQLPEYYYYNRFPSHCKQGGIFSRIERPILSFADSMSANPQGGAVATFSGLLEASAFP